MKSKWKYYGVYRSSHFENYEIKESHETFPDTFYNIGTYYLQEVFKTYKDADDFIDNQKKNSQRSREDAIYGM